MGRRKKEPETPSFAPNDPDSGIQPSAENPLQQATIPTTEPIPTAAATSESFVDRVGKVKAKYEDGVADKRADKIRKYKKRKKIEEPDAEQKKKLESFARLLTLAMNSICTRLPNPLPLSETEKEVFGSAANDLAEKYVPKLGEYQPEISMLAALVLILPGRFMKDEDNGK